MQTPPPRWNQICPLKLNIIPQPPPFRPFASWIEHTKYSEKPLESLGRMIGYPSNSRKYDRKVHLLEAVLTCFKTKIRQNQTTTKLGIFAWCLRKDSRMPSHIRNFADSAVRASATNIRFNENLLRVAHEQLTRTIEHARNNYAYALSLGSKPPSVRWERIVRELKNSILQYQKLYDQLRSTRKDSDWNPAYPASQFEAVLSIEYANAKEEDDKRLAIAKGLSETKGKSGKSLPNNIKRNVMNRVRNSLRRS